MDICFSDCLYYIIRSRTSNDGLAVVQVPHTDAIPNGEIYLDSMTMVCLADQGDCMMEWRGHAIFEAGDNRKNIEVKFRYNPSADDGSLAYPELIRGEHVILAPTDKEYAETALVIGQLDYFKAKEVRAINPQNTSIELMYQGKVDPAGD